MSPSPSHRGEGPQRCDALRPTSPVPGCSHALQPPGARSSGSCRPEPSRQDFLEPHDLSVSRLAVRASATPDDLDSTLPRKTTVKRRVPFPPFLALMAAALIASAAGQPVALRRRRPLPCSQYANQAAALRARDTRDADGDGLYCESLPCLCAKATAAAEVSLAPLPRPHDHHELHAPRGIVGIPASPSPD